VNHTIQVLPVFIFPCLFQQFEGKLNIFERVTVSVSTQLQAHKLVSSVVCVCYM